MVGSKAFVLVCCVLLNIVFNCEATVDIKYKDQELYGAERILEFICLKTSCKPRIIEKNQENYLNEIIRCLENEEVFKTITKLLVENNSLPQKSELTQGERGLLLSLCLYQYCKSTPLYWSKVSEAIGVFPALNIFFDADAVNPSHHGDTGYATYQISQNKILVLQLVGRGCHNNSYLLWQIKMKDGKFSAVLLDIPFYIEESKSFRITSEFIAKSCFYDFDEAHFIVKVNSGYINGWKEEEDTYQIKDDKLTLVHKKECKTLFFSDK